jgi:hypothetical protein
VSHDEYDDPDFRDDQEYYRLLLKGNWQLEDLYELPHAFDQCYAFIYCLDSELDIRDRERIDGAFAAYPWRGGYSYVNIYTVLRNQVPWQHRPRVKAIQKASPGWLDLFLNAEVAIQVAQSVAALAGAGVAATKAYAFIKKTLSQIKVDREKAKLQELQLTAAQHKTLMGMCETMAKFLGFKNLKDLHARTGSPEVSLKLLSAHYRRTSVLLEYVESGKVELPQDADG